MTCTTLRGGLQTGGHRGVSQRTGACHGGAAFQSAELPGNIGIILNLSPTHPRSDAPEDRQAAHDADLLLNRSFLDPVAKGRYPAALLQLLERHGLMPHR